MSKIHYPKATKNLNKDEILELARRACEGDSDAKEKIIILHLPLVEQMIPRFLKSGVERDDLYQEGCMGLLIAMDRFDPGRNVRFDTYASYWVEKRMRLASFKQNYYQPIAPTDLQYKLMQKYRAAFSQLCKKLARVPTRKEVSEFLGIGESEVKQMEMYVYLFAYQVNLSANYYKDQEDIPEEVQTIIQNSTEDQVFRRLVKFEPSEWGVVLTMREKMVLCRHLGFTPSGQPESFSDISADTGWSIETLRKDYVTAIQKIKDKIN